ncbi:MAG: tetratricopeptide repeat protein [bacterium]
MNIFSKLSLAKKARKTFELAVKLDENNVEAREGLIIYHLNAPGIAGGDLNKALQQAQILVKMDERKGRTLLARLYQKKKKMSLAAKEYQRLEALCGDSPECSDFYNSYGYFLLQQKRYDEAIVKFQKQVELAPDKANPHDSLGDGYRAAGRLADAADEYRRALQIDETFEPSGKKLEKVMKQLND